jgi:hypothetical protein
MIEIKSSGCSLSDCDSGKVSLYPTASGGSGTQRIHRFLAGVLPASRDFSGIMPLTNPLPPELPDKLPQRQKDESKESPADDTNSPNVVIGSGSVIALQPLFWIAN